MKRQRLGENTGGIATNDYKEIKDTVPAVSKTFFIFAL